MRPALRLLAVLLLCAAPPALAEDFKVVVHPDNPAGELGRTASMEALRERTCDWVARSFTVSTISPTARAWSSSRVLWATMRPTESWICRIPSTDCWAEPCPCRLKSAARRATSSTEVARLEARAEVCSSWRVVVLVWAMPVACRSSSAVCARVSWSSSTAAPERSPEAVPRVAMISRSRPVMRRKAPAGCRGSPCSPPRR